MGWDGVGCDGMGWDGMGWDGMGCLGWMTRRTLGGLRLGHAAHTNIHATNHAMGFRSGAANGSGRTKGKAGCWTSLARAPVTQHLDLQGRAVAEMPLETLIVTRRRKAKKQQQMIGRCAQSAAIAIRATLAFALFLCSAADAACPSTTRTASWQGTCCG